MSVGQVCKLRICQKTADKYLSAARIEIAHLKCNSMSSLHPLESAEWRCFPSLSSKLDFTGHRLFWRLLADLTPNYPTAR